MPPPPWLPDALTAVDPGRALEDTPRAAAAVVDQLQGVVGAVKGLKGLLGGEWGPFTDFLEHQVWLLTAHVLLCVQAIMVYSLHR